MPLLNETPAGGLTRITAEEQLIVSQCKVLLVADDVSALTHDSPLSAWIKAWDRAGILDSVMTAVLGDIDLARFILRSHQLELEDIEVAAWPVWGLLVLSDEHRQQLNTQVLNRSGFHYQEICVVSMHRCKRYGTEATLMDWWRVWKGSSIRNSFMAAVAGVGHCYQPANISQCEMETNPPSVSYRIGVLLASTYRRTKNPSYVLSGYLRRSPLGGFYGYHPLTREQIPSVDVFSWLSRNRLAVTQLLYGSHPFSLIEHSVGTELARLDGLHVMGIHIRKMPSSGSESTPVAYDVVRVPDLRCGSTNAGFISAASLPSTRRMPGVFPDTWIIDSSEPSDQSRIRQDGMGLYLCRAADPFESIINHWLIQVASSCGVPMHRSHESFRTAKNSDANGPASKFLLYPASEYAVRIRGDYSSRSYSKFRLPMGSLIGSSLALNGINQDETHPISSRRAVEHLIDMIRLCMRQPQPDLNCLLRWLVFDSLIGTVSQIAYRYQIVSLDAGLSLSPIPFWSTDSDSSFCERTRIDFGYQALICRNEARRMFDDEYLGSLATYAGLQPDALKRYRAECVTSLARSAATVSARLENEARMNGALHSPLFRNAKSMVEWISEIEQPNGVDL